MPLVNKTFSDIITFTRASTATYFDSAGVLQSAAIDVPRFDYDPATLAARGLLIEEQRTNSIRNNTMQGAVAGTPGTAPTNWAIPSPSSGLSAEIIGTGVEAGITYIDVRYFGTATGTNIIIAFETTLQIAALNGQTWTNSVWVKVISGAANNYTLRISLRDSGGAGLGQIDTLFTPTSTLTRFFNTGTLADASVAFVAPQFRFGLTIGVAYDFTLRIGLPQLEEGAFATSVIPTTTTALTRSADVASVNTLSPWFNGTEGTLFAEGTAVNNIAGTTPREYAEFGNAAGTDRIAVEARSATSTRARTLTGGVSVISSDTYDALGKNVKITGAYGLDGITVCVDGRAPITTASAIPTPDTLYLGFNFAASAASVINGHIRRLTYYPRRLSNAELVSITS